MLLSLSKVSAAVALLIAATSVTAGKVEPVEIGDGVTAEDAQFWKRFLQRDGSTSMAPAPGPAPGPEPREDWYALALHFYKIGS